jgi:hypothetical protein
VRVMSPIIAVLLAITMAVFPISMPRAAAFGQHGHAQTAKVVQDEAASAADHQNAGDHGHADTVASCDPAVLGGCSEPQPSSHDGTTPACCGAGMCHAFEVSAAPAVFSPHLSPGPTVQTGDEQVDEAVSGRLDRPPRTV